MARPSDYTPEIADDICKHLGLGYSLVKICALLNLEYRTVLRWLDSNVEFSRNYARAREDQADYWADEIMELADQDPQMILNRSGEKVIDNAWVTHQKNRIDARKWVASKLKPKKYGDKQEIAMTLKRIPLPEEDESLLDEYVGAKPQ